jgi:hypothetical protein
MNNSFDGVKEWKCKNGHILGVVRRSSFTTQGGQRGHVSRLMLYRQAISLDMGVEVDVIAVVEGTALDVRCSICGEVRPWYIGQDELERLMDRIAPHRPYPPAFSPDGSTPSGERRHMKAGKNDH